MPEWNVKTECGRNFGQWYAVIQFGKTKLCDTCAAESEIKIL